MRKEEIVTDRMSCAAWRVFLLHHGVHDLSTSARPPGSLSPTSSRFSVGAQGVYRPPDLAPSVLSSRLLKKPSMAFSATPPEKCDSWMAHIFNG